MIIFMVIIVIITAAFVFKVLSTKKSYPPQSRVIDPLKITIQDIDRMEDGTDFEEYLYRLFLALGYIDAYKTQGSRDFGSDLVFTDREGYRNVVQAKRYSNPVGLGAVQEVYGSMRYYRAKKSMVISSNQYTSACEELAGYNAVKLHNRSDLINIMDLFKSGEINKAKDIIESEPRIILDSWDNYMNSNKVIKKDFKAEKRLVTKNK
ncbi:restriction endonuclease [Paenibacillus sp. FSL H7-0716]|uniref:Endonuclease n=1 Tax=Paenibacillus odorifer TaxID=189426 RepID=A0AB36J9V6_9BACL|nr:restriction endonuclease [Paenibacillus odorifer]OME07083.1 endonuclease [Paenibacillus odorifer]OME11106.1 endonuclease [Paenibacillus odorifer]